MSTTDALDGLIVFALASIVGALELLGRHPQYPDLLVRNRYGLLYVGVNGSAGLLAFALALILDVTFREPSDFWRILLCGAAGVTVLRSGVVRESGLAGPAQALLNLREAYELEIDHTVQIRQSQAAEKTVDGLSWGDDQEALGAMCLIISHRNTQIERDAMAERIKSVEQMFPAADLRLYALAVSLSEVFGLRILKEAARKTREAKEESAEIKGQ